MAIVFENRAWVSDGQPLPQSMAAVGGINGRRLFTSLPSLCSGVRCDVGALARCFQSMRGAALPVVSGATKGLLISRYTVNFLAWWSAVGLAGAYALMLYAQRFIPFRVGAVIEDKRQDAGNKMKEGSYRARSRWFLMGVTGEKD